MAKNYLDKTGLALVWEKIKNALSGKVDKETGKGLSSNDYTSEEKTKLANVASGAQVNVLEGIQKNGTNVEVTNKIANITVPTKTSDITNDSGFITASDIPEGVQPSATAPQMDGTASAGTSAAYSRGDHVHPTDTSRASAADLTALDGRVEDLEEAVGTGGSVDSKITAAIQALDSSVNATTNEAISSITIVDGKITGSTKTTIPTNNSQLTNGAGYQTASDVSDAIDTAIQGLDSSVAATTNEAIASLTVVDGKITGSTKATIPTNNNQLTNGAGYQTAADVTAAIGDAISDITSFEFEVVNALPATGTKGVIYLIGHNHGTGDVYDEYLWLGAGYEKIGNTDIDLSGYVLSADLVAITSGEIDTICT